MLPIDDNDAFKIRANAGDGPDCDVNPVDPIPLTTPLPPEIPCDDPPEPDVEVFFEPTPAPTPVKQLRLPGTIKLYSPELPITCPPGETTETPPADTVLDFGAITRSVNFTDITDENGAPLFNQTTLYNLTSVAGTIRDSVYSYLGDSAPPQDPERSEHISVNFSSKVAEVVAITKLPTSVVVSFWNFILNQQAAIDEAAQALADRQLECGYFNEDLWVVCYDRDAGEYRVVYALPDDPNAVPVPAGSTFSSVDQATANRLAIQSAAGVPACQFDNEEQEVSCAELFGGDFLDSVLFSWPSLDDTPTTKISDIGGHVILDESANVSLSSVEGYKALTYADVAARGAAAVERELVLTVTIPAGAVTGITQSEANAKARAVALSYLDCFIPARQRTVKCTDEVISEPAHTQALATSDDEVLSEIVTGYTTLAHLLPTIRPDNTTFVAGPAIDERVGVRLHLPAGAFVAESRQAADASAESFALSNAATKLDCNWTNRSLTYACDDSPEYESPLFHLTDTLYHGQNGVIGVTYTGPYEIDQKLGQMLTIAELAVAGGAGGLVELMASVEKSAPYVATTDRGEFDSPNSQAGADAVAAAHAMSQLRCVYCNPYVEPNCPPEGSDISNENLPLSPEILGGEYSYDTTRGAPGLPYAFDVAVTPHRWRIVADPCGHSASGEVPKTDPVTLICSEDPSDVGRVTDTTGSEPLRNADTQEECRYCNDYVTVACCPNPDPDPGDPVPEEYLFDAEQCADLVGAFDSFNIGECAGDSISDPFAVVAIPACSMFAGSKEAANELALNIAKSQLNCLFGNEERCANCPDKCTPLIGTDFSIEVNGYVYGGSHTECLIVGVESACVEAGLFKSQCSKEQADLQAQAAADAQIVCLWTNNDQTAECPDKGPENIFHDAAVTSATIEQGTIVTDQGTPYANEIALRIAVLQLFCVYTNELRCRPCVEYGGPRTFSEADNAGTLHTDTCIDEDYAPDNPEGECIQPGTILSSVDTPTANLLAEELLPSIPCLFVNNEVSVSCEDRGLKAEGANTDVTIAAGEVVDSLLCNATEQAFRMAVAQLVCLWTNNPQTRCCDILGSCKTFTAADNAGDEHTETCESEWRIGGGVGSPYVPNDPNCGDGPSPPHEPNDPTAYDNPPPSAGTQVDENDPSCITIPTNTVVTPLGTAEADVIAQSLLPRIPCEWESNPVDVACVDKGEPHSSAVLEVGLPQGAVTSTYLCQATEIAFRMAVAELICMWTNEEQSRDCVTVGGPRAYEAADNAGDLHASACVVEQKAPDSPGVETIPTDTIATPLGTAIANEMAKAMLPTIPCLWCSNPADVACVNKGRAHPSSVLAAAVQFCDVKSSTFCEASEIAFRMAVAQLVCLWTNNEQIDGNCPAGFVLVQAGVQAAETIIAPTTAIADQIALGIAKASKVCEQEFFCNDEQTDDDCGDGSEGAGTNRWELDEEGKVDECTIWTTDKDTANDIAKAIATAKKRCKPVERDSNSVSGNTSICGDDEDDVCNSMDLEAGAITTYGMTQDEVDAIAQALADAQTVCCPEQYGNTDCYGNKDCTDADGTSVDPCETGYVGANLIWSYDSHEDAEAIAQGIADAQTFCCPKVYWNTSVQSTDNCSTPDVQCYNHIIAAYSIPSWESAEDATATAQSICDALSICCKGKGSGSAEWIDCEGTAVFTLEWDEGFVTTDTGSSEPISIQLGSCNQTSGGVP